MKKTPVTFPCGDITLEGEWLLPQTKTPFPVVVVCHPHPLYGGNMSNNVVLAIGEALSQQSIAAFRFNFRGVGRSEGAFGGGIAEQEDAEAALTYVSAASEINPQRIGLAGYSFGAGVALPVAVQDQRVKLLALVSPAISDSGWEQLKGYQRPKFLAVGGADEFIPLDPRHVEDIPEPKQYQIIPGADHFWRGYEEELAQKVAQFFVDGFSQVHSTII